jgi:AAA domain, putative AbiEii toxin, Type IV TA system
VPSEDSGSWGYSISRIRFSDGSNVSVPLHGAVLIVGPNNAGKSAALREIAMQMQPAPPFQPDPKVVLDIEVEPQGTEDDLEEWLNDHAFRRQQPEGLHYQRPGAHASLDRLKAEWGQVQAHASSDPPQRARIQQLLSFVLFQATAPERLGLLGDVGTYDPISEAPSHPLQVLFARPDLEKQLSDDAEEAFGVGVALSKVWGSALRLHMGKLDLEPSIPPTPEYVEALRSLPLATEQGDGVRSFLGLLLALRAAGYPIVIVDEPEAFLHPPQARLLGRKLVSSQATRTQVFAATHNSDVLRGALDVPDADIQIIRIVREGEVNKASVLSPDELRHFWSDPLLRYSNVLEGLFHKGVVVSEGDADSRFYSAVLDGIREQGGSPPHDLLFTQSNGKERLPTVLRALRSLEVPAAAIADFDILRDEGLLRNMVTTLGGDWDFFSSDWKSVKNSLEQLGNAPALVDVRAQVEAAFEGMSGTRLEPRGAALIKKAAQLGDSWGVAKRGGLSVLSQGPVFQTATRLLEGLKQLGLFVVPVGELERWVPEIPNKGPRWVGDVLESKKHADPHAPAREFVKEVAEHLGSPA